jgi:hypothetical protein
LILGIEFCLKIELLFVFEELDTDFELILDIGLELRFEIGDGGKFILDIENEFGDGGGFALDD